MKRKYGQDKVWKQKNERRSVGSGLSLVFVVFNPWVGRPRVRGFSLLGIASFCLTPRRVRGERA